MAAGFLLDDVIAKPSTLPQILLGLYDSGQARVEPAADAPLRRICTPGRTAEAVKA